MIGNQIKMFVIVMCSLAAVTALAAGIILVFHHGLGMRIKTQATRFDESARELDNPNRGFYFIYDFWITDSETDYESVVADRYQKDSETNLTLIQICLQDYQEGEISEAGMKNIRALFQALEVIDKQLIVRFVYDREGKNLLYEPQNLNIILKHMEQLGPVLQEHGGQIFILQGLFIGNWGEMHGSRYTQEECQEENLRRLASQLARVTDPSTYLAVRTPAQWRIIIQSYGLKDGTLGGNTLSRRIGLFNDGMFGNENDYGTYGTKTKTETAPGQYEKWNRADEMAFQEELCCLVPNGGEVITPNSYNDMENAIEGMATMHVSYLNRAYDDAVLKKWANTTVTEEGCFDGMDGLTYVERHLGYRLLIDEVDYIYRVWENRLSVNIVMKNVGFAPVYREPIMELKLYNEKTAEISTIVIEDSLSDLVGGNAIVLLCCFIILDNFLYLRRWWKFAYLLLRGNGETSDIYISCKNDIEKLKGINIREIITRYLKKWTIAIVRLLIKLKILLVTLLSNMDRGLMLYAFLFSCMLVVGGKMNLRGNPYFHPMIFADFLWIAVLFCLSLVVSSILKLINSKCLMEMQTGEISKRWWPCAWLLLIILWSPYLLAYYPGTLSADSFTSLEQVKDLGLLYNHVPIAYTLLIAFFVRIGWEIGDANFGVFLFSFIQMVVMAGVLSYSSYWVRKKVKYPVAAFGTLLFYGLNPIVALYSITMWKDVLFSAWIILLCLFLFDIAEDGGRKLGEKKSLLWIGLLFILISFGRNNGVYVVFFCWIVLLLIYKNVRKKLLLLGGGIILSVALIQGPGYKSLGIAQTGFVESVGIPLQQICYTVVTDGPLEEKEQEFLENIIPIDAIKKNYSPVSADDIKFNKEFNTSFFEQNKPGFVKLYLKLLPSHFQAYVQAYLLSTSGFWHIEPIYWVTAEEIYENDMGIYNVDYLKKYFHFDWKKVVSRMVSSLRDGPLANVGLMVWFVFFYAVMCFSQKQSWKSILALPLIGCWLTLMIATPVNSQFRYVYYYHLMLPIVCILFFVGKENL